MPTVVRVLIVAVAATAVLVVGGVILVGPDEAEPPAAPEVQSVPLADLDTSVLAVGRTDFCAEMAPEHVEEALGGAPAQTASYENGDRAALAPDVTDVAHEFGCSWTGADGSVARGWVFAPPVTAARAGQLARDAARDDGCRRLLGAAPFGDPSVGVVCGGGGTRTVSSHGLFGDAWLSCSLSAPTGPAREELAERADRWCAAVALTGSSAPVPD